MTIMRFTHHIRQSRLSLALGSLVAWTALVTLYSCTKTVAGATQDSTYYGRLPFVIKDNSTYSDYYSALQMTGLLDSLSSPGPYTVLLPNNDAFNGGYGQFTNDGASLLDYFILSVGQPALPGYISYTILGGSHNLQTLPLGDNQELTSIQGGKVYISRYLSGTDTVSTVNGQMIISLNNHATNGAIDVVTGALPNPQIYPTVFQTLQSDTNFAYFTAALKVTHLDAALEGPGPFTVLAPMNSSFKNAGQVAGINTSSIDSLLVADTAKLSQLIRYHILSGRYFLNDFRRRTTDTLALTMLNGETMKYVTGSVPGFFPETATGPLFYGLGNLKLPYNSYATISYLYQENPDLNGASRGDRSDLPAANGVVHLLNGMLIP